MYSILIYVCQYLSALERHLHLESVGDFGGEGGTEDCIWALGGNAAQLLNHWTWD